MWRGTGWCRSGVRRPHGRGDEGGDGLVPEPCRPSRTDPRLELAEQERLLVGRLAQGPRDEGPTPGTSLGQSLLFQIPVRPVHGVGVDGDLPDHIADGGELVAGPEQAEAQGVTDLVDELAVRGNTGPPVEPEFDGRRRLHANNCTSILVQLEEAVSRHSGDRVRLAGHSAAI
jgi:hypothetical protein